MIKEYLSLYFTSYIYTSLFLIPIMVFYIYILYKKTINSVILGTHKTIIIATLIMPLLIIAYSSSKILNINTIQNTSSVKISNISIKTNSYSNMADVNIMPPSTPNYKVTDIVFYFADMISILSLLGFCLLLLRYAIQCLALSKVKRRSSTISVQDNISIITSAEIISPFATGLINKKIYLPQKINNNNKKIVIKHEVNHFKYNHHKWSFIETILAHIFWYNPISHILKTKGNILREIECDDKTIKEVNKFDYSKALIDSAEEISAPNKHTLLAHSWIEKEVLKKRVENILGEKKSKKRFTISLFSYGSIGLTVLFFVISGNINSDLLESQILQNIKSDHLQLLKSRNTVQLQKVPKHFINTLLIHEDANYYSHDGVNLFHVARAAGTNLKSILSGGPKYVSGGSTITQQLAKSFLKEEKSLKRKFKELKIARILEKNFSKDEMLEMYLNRVYLGNESWGLADGSKKYFGHTYEQLSIEESAMIIPFLEAPTKYNVIKNPSVAKRRQKRLLQK